MPSDLSTIAQSLDSLEQRVDQGRVGRESANMDDTGVHILFVRYRYLNMRHRILLCTSIRKCTECLGPKVIAQLLCFGLRQLMFSISLVRWRSEVMQPHHDQPQYVYIVAIQSRRRLVAPIELSALSF